jgi:hypothetical protein
MWRRISGKLLDESCGAFPVGARKLGYEGGLQRWLASDGLLEALAVATFGGGVWHGSTQGDATNVRGAPCHPWLILSGTDPPFNTVGRIKRSSQEVYSKLRRNCKIFRLDR